MTTEIYPATDFIGGGAGALDAIPVATLDAMDAAQIMSASVHVPYTLNAVSGAAENSPWIIAPNDVGGGDQRWEMISVHALGFEATVPSGDPKIVFDIGGTDKWYIGVDDDDSDKLVIGTGATVGTNAKISLDGTNIDLNSQNLTSVGTIRCETIGVGTGVTVNRAISAAPPDVANNMGVFGYTGRAQAANYGVYGYADGAGTVNYGVSGYAVSAGTNYAFYSSHGNSRFADNVDIAAHDAATIGLKLGGTLVTASAAEINAAPHDFTTLNAIIAVADAAVDFNSQNLTSVGTIEIAIDVDVVGGGDLAFISLINTDGGMADGDTWGIDAFQNALKLGGIRWEWNVARTAIDTVISGYSGGATEGLRITGNGDVDIIVHDAATEGLMLGGVLVTASAVELNQLDGNLLIAMTEIQEVETITGAVADGYAAALKLDPGYTAATAQTVTRHNYIDIQDVSVAGVGPAAVTNAAVMRFDAAIATHKAVLAAFQTTDSGTHTTDWAAGIIVNIDGTLYKIPVIAV